MHVILSFDMFRVMRQRLMIGVFAATVAMFGFSAANLYAAEVQFSDINDDPESTTVQGIIFAGICDTSVEAQGGTDTCACRDEGNCSLDDALQVFANIAIFILGISGSAVRVCVDTSDYSRRLTWVESGKAAMTGGVIGLMIIFGAYVALNFIISGLTTDGGTPESQVLEKTVNQGFDDTDRESAVENIFTTETE